MRARAMGHWELGLCVLLSVLSLACGQCVSGSAGTYSISHTRVYLTSLLCQSTYTGTYVLQSTTHEDWPWYKLEAPSGGVDKFLYTTADRNAYYVSDTLGGYPWILVIWNGEITTTATVLEACEWEGELSRKLVPNAFQSLSDTVCFQCPQNSTSPSASILITACQCNEGFTGPDGGPCSQCGTGTYKSGLGSATCESCPSDSIFVPGNGSSLTIEKMEYRIQSKVYHSTIVLSSGFVCAVALGDELIVVPNDSMTPLQYLITFHTKSHIFTNDKLHFNKPSIMFHVDPLAQRRTLLEG